MATINFPDGSMLIDDSELNPAVQARRMAHEGINHAEIAAELAHPLATVQGWIAEAPYESPEDYWMRRYNEGTHMDDDFTDDEDNTAD